jgi:hypothetical protein
MSVMIKTEVENSVERTLQSGVSTIEQPRPSYRLKQSRREDEPLEEAFEDSEPPESGAGPRREAPDAGDGHLYHDDREFKHGRSRG